MKKIIFYLLFIASSATLHSCYTPRYVYSPSSSNVPLFNKKGDSKIGISYVGQGNGNFDQATSKSNGVDIQAAYSPVEKFFIHGMYSGRKENNIPKPNVNNNGEDELYYKRRYQELGLGYYVNLNDQKDFTFQVSAAYGTGTNDLRDLSYIPGTTTDYNTEMNKFYVQPGIQFRATSQFILAFSSRIERLKFHNIKTGYNDMDLTNFYLNGLGSSTLSYINPEFIFAYRIRSLQNLEINTQFGATVPLNDQTQYFRHRNSFLSIGLAADLREIFKNSSTK